jgi:hypothetical protein
MKWPGSVGRVRGSGIRKRLVGRRGIGPIVSGQWSVVGGWLSTGGASGTPGGRQWYPEYLGAYPPGVFWRWCVRIEGSEDEFWVLG